MFKVVKTDSIIPVVDRYTAVFDGLGVNFVAAPCETEDDLIRECADADALLVLKEPITARVIASLRHCRVISRFGAGVDNIDVAAAKAAGIPVAIVPDASVEEVSTHAVAMILALVRRLPRYDRAIREGFYSALRDGGGIRRTNSMSVGLLGLGRIGAMTARKLSVFGFTLWAHDPYASDAALSAAGVERRPLDEIVAKADVISLHVPLTAETANLINASRLEAMKQDAILVNVSRGGLIDETALARLLRAGKLAGAGIDAFAQEPLPSDSSLRDAPNTLLSPHAAFCSREAFHEVCFKAFDNAAKAFRGAAAR
jgi:D-3-phosphoglycerate dehydrogenase / 2-oxoglutarate reductase